MPSIRVDGWRSGIRFDAAHMIPHHPKCGRLHGHTYALHAEVHGDVDPATGFVMDFGTVKDVLRQVADRLDHHVLVQSKSPHFEVVRRHGQVAFTVGMKHYVIPEEDAELLPVEATTAEALAEYVADQVLSLVDFPPTVKRLDVGIDETYGKGAWTTRPLG
ncbi:MAG TPA: 6-pyruvoyl tetrahydropterin synthase family protein [Candidatus Thermoplasmatota archaeon]|nr:6-pyruvoyl tetrahydropterin synthase family protein [Candidatus Thermoplasmatota archaeon]